MYFVSNYKNKAVQSINQSMYCLHTSSCQAVNYNFTSNQCSHFTATCPKAMSHPTMAFGLFTRKQSHQCIDWIPKPGHSRYFRWDRSVSPDNRYFVARMQMDGNDFMASLPPLNNRCYGRYNGGNVYTSSRSYPPCQYLYIRDGCTVYFVDYEIGAPLPPNVVIGGYTSTGLPVYIGHRNGRVWSIGSYTLGSNKVIAYIGGNFNEDVMLLVLLWT